MRLLTIHADRFSFAVTGESTAVALAGEPEALVHGAALEDLLVAFMAVEKGDEADPQDVAEQAAEQVRDTARRVGAKRVMVYPYAHLSSDLASARAARDVLDRVAVQLHTAGGLEVSRAPFGFYKSFDIAAKGHPLSELAATVIPRARSGGADHGSQVSESEAIAAEKTLRSQWRIYRADGSYVPADEFDFSAEPGLRKLYNYEREGTRRGGRPAAHQAHARTGAC